MILLEAETKETSYQNFYINVNYELLRREEKQRDKLA